ncbi:MAG: ABC transporter substrate-binding protein [Nitrospirota bacterium]
MTLKRFLILAPVVLVIFLLQSFLWVPTYEEQTTGNPDRLLKFIEASIGDAKILNPILNADTASSRITGLVFEGLLDLDEHLELRGRLATSWTITEEAYVLVNPEKRFPDGTPVTARALEARIRRGIEQGSLPRLKELVTDIAVLPAQARTVPLPLPDQTIVQAHLRLPERVKVTLREVDQDFFRRLKAIVGEGYETGAPLERWIKIEPAEKREAIRPYFSELVPVFEHNPVITFLLRKGVRFHDGHEFDARDVKFTYEAIMNPKNLSPRTADFEPIKSVEIMDLHAVRVVYKRLFSPAMYAWTMGILPEHLLNEEALTQEMNRRVLSEAARSAFGLRDSEFNRHPVGVGPFRFVEWQSDELIRLARFDDYWEGAPLYRDFFYRVIPDYVTQEVEFRTGAIDTYGPLPHQAARYKVDDDYQAFTSLGFSYAYIGYNHRRAPFSDTRVRRALGMAINVDEIVQYILYGEGERTTGPFPKNTPWYDHAVEPIPYDPEGAVRLLEQLGWRRNTEGWLEKDGKVFEFNLITNQGNPIRKAIMTIAQNNWRRIGIKCNTQVFEWAVFLEDFVNPGQFDALILGWSMGIDPDLYQIWHSTQAGPHQLNFVGYKNPEVDALLVRIRQEYDVQTQQRLTHQLHRLIAEDQPYTFLYAGLGTQVLDKKIVVVRDDGSFAKITPTKAGDIFFHFNRWKKLEMTPTF